MIINLQKFDTWKIQLTIAINFFSSNDVEEERVMHSKSNHVDNANEVVDELFKATFQDIPSCLRNNNMRE